MDGVVACVVAVARWLWPRRIHPRWIPRQNSVQNEATTNEQWKTISDNGMNGVDHGAQPSLPILPPFISVLNVPGAAGYAVLSDQKRSTRISRIRIGSGYPLQCACEWTIFGERCGCTGIPIVPAVGRGRPGGR